MAFREKSSGTKVIEILKKIPKKSFYRNPKKFFLNHNQNLIPLRKNSLSFVFVAFEKFFFGFDLIAYHVMSRGDVKQ